MARLMAVFLPWFYLGAWVEGRHIGRATLDVVRSQQPKVEKAFAVIFAAGLLFVFLYAARSHLVARLRFGGTLQNLADQFSDKDEAAQWLKQNRRRGRHFSRLLRFPAASRNRPASGLADRVHDRHSF